MAILALVAFALLLAAVLAFAFVKGERSTDDAYVTGHLHTISSRVSGTVQEVLVDDNQFVHAGQVLVRLDTRDFDVQVALQRSRVEQSRSDQDSARAQISQTEAAIAAATADARKGDLNFVRARELTAEAPRGLSQQDFDAADAARTTAHARVRQATAQLEAAQAGLLAARALESQSTANLRDASLQLTYTNIIAPTDGYVGKKTVETGQRLVPGQPLLTVVEADVWVVANFRETQLRHVEVGDAVDLHIDAVPDTPFHGHVDSFAPATGAQFALLPPDNATGNFTKVVQRVPVKIRFDGLKDPDYRIRPGLSVTATLAPRGNSR
ncbi:HlyD family secretion protein [Paraburkholderia dipogonis]|uniref:HlyD family secretion protein n=1 Tax=Paraburkholderia dipogonis TaxID=1211383 RepID=UPI0038BAC5B1